MSTNYYYLTASLPYLDFAQEVPISVSDFISECEKWLSEKELSVVRNLGLNDYEINKNDPPSVITWKEFNKYIKGEINKIRISRREESRSKVSSPFQEIFHEANPLLMEKKFEKIRWNYIEEEDSKYFFDINWLSLYLLKLKILERLAGFQKEKGKQKFSELCEVNYG